MLLPLISSVLLSTLSPSQGAPIPIELVDMTYTFDETTLYHPSQKKFELKVLINETSEQGFWLQMEEYFSGIHVGTHMDAPCHVAMGKWCIDEIPLERFKAPAAVVDIIDKAEADPDSLVEIDDLTKWEEITGKSLNGTIVVMKSGWGRRWGDKEAFIGTPDNDVEKLHFPGMSPEAAQWLMDNREIYGVASESLSLDHGKSKDLISHRILFRNNIFGLENVANVEKIPIDGATLHVMPMKIGKGSGAPTRIIASFPKATPRSNECAADRYSEAGGNRKCRMQGSTEL